MATILITFTDELNASLQVGDIAYSNTRPIIQAPAGGGMLGPMQFAMYLGPVLAITGLVVKIQTPSPQAAPNVDDFVFFSKNKKVNTSSLLGYYADVKIENNSWDEVELFSIGSDVSESSK